MYSKLEPINGVNYWLGNSLIFFKDLFILCMWIHCHFLQTPQRRASEIRFELRTFGRAVSAPNRWANSPAPKPHDLICLVMLSQAPLEVCFPYLLGASQSDKRVIIKNKPRGQEFVLLLQRTQFNSQEPRGGLQTSLSPASGDRMPEASLSR